MSRVISTTRKPSGNIKSQGEEKARGTKEGLSVALSSTLWISVKYRIIRDTVMAVSIDKTLRHNKQQIRRSRVSSTRLLKFTWNCEVLSLENSIKTFLISCRLFFACCGTRAEKLRGWKRNKTVRSEAAGEF